MATEPQSQSERDVLTLLLNRTTDSQLYDLGKSALNLFLYTSAYLALVAVAEVVIVTELLSLPLTAAPAVAGLLTFAVYGNDRISDLETDAVSAPRRTAYVRRYKDILYVLAALSYGLAVALAVLGGPLAFALSLLPGAIWLLYAQDWLPSIGTNVRRLKEVAVLSSALVAGAWALVIVFLPLAFAGASLTPAAGIVFLFFFLATFVNTEIPNVRDMEGDRQIGVDTLPTLFGVRRTRHLLYGICVLTAVILGGAVAADLLSPVSAGVLVLSLACLAAVTFCLGRVDDEDGLSIAAECTRLPALLLVALTLLGH
ncbi:UbiA family prenyltransferase [Halomicroarcula sp. GCM10025324]|uniref:UbiA family prenyltransferase n=1 Tax=Haloarcula TaxID=2237 RepID=UPI0023E8653E|nr:UbiA family prenyltransferase [Halomicroarcula sp. ZS-22-S1]